MNAVINEKAILVADSGSTKTDWALMLVGAGEASPVTLQTQGINPVLMSEDDVAAILQDELLPRLEQLLPIMAMGQGLEVFFYGAGVRPDMVSKMERAFRRAMGFHETVVGRMWQADVLLHFNSDLLGAVGWPVAMGNADPELRSMARIVAPSDVEDGVARVIEAYVFGNGEV
jgi:hypothetical protein